MNTRLLGVIIVLAVALAALQAIFGDSAFRMPAFFVLAFVVLEWASETRRWLQSVFAAAAAVALFTLYQFVAPLNHGEDRIGIAILAAAVAVPVLRSAFTRYPEGEQHG